MSLQLLKSGILDDDVQTVRAALLMDKEILYKSIGWGNNREGFALNYTASLGRTEIIRTLVEEFGAKINLQKGVGNKWTALHHACDAGSLRGVETLLELGADPRLKDDDGKTPADISKSSDIRYAIISFVTSELPKPKADKHAVEWKLGAPDEVSSARLSPDGAFRLTEIFNFSLRRVTALAQEIKTKSLAQTVTYFDDIPDKRVLHEAHEKLASLGGTADAAAIDRAALPGKKLSGGGRQP